MTFRYRAAAVLAAMITVAGCGSNASTTSGADTGAPAPTAGTGTAAAPAPTGGGGSAAASAAVTKAVAKAYTAVFDYRSPVATARKYLQHGSVLVAALAAQAKQGVQERLQVRVKKVVTVSPNTVAVTFALLGPGGKALVPDASGNAVRENGTWKVAAKTVCGLLQLQSAPPKACNDPQITALPH